MTDKEIENPLIALSVRLERIERKVDDIIGSQGQHGEALAALGGDTMHTHERIRELAEDVDRRVSAIERRLDNHIRDTEPAPGPGAL